MMNLHDALSEYEASRRALGSQFRWPGSALRRFVEFLERQGADFITTDLAVRWAMEPAGVQRATRAARLPSPKGLRAQTHVTLIGLLAATGLRPGEALALDVHDVDLHDGVLKIRKTKFGKSRFVPVEETTRAALARYAERRDELIRRPRTDAFLVSENGSRLGGCSVRRTFAELSRGAGLRPPPEGRRSGKGPRLHDLRHTFATRRLVEWYQEGVDVNRKLPDLATYLGHVHVAYTYWYIQAVPELLRLSTERGAAPQKEGGR